MKKFISVILALSIFCFTYAFADDEYHECNLHEYMISNYTGLQLAFSISHMHHEIRAYRYGVCYHCGDVIDNLYEVLRTEEHAFSRTDDYHDGSTNYHIYVWSCDACGYTDYERLVCYGNVTGGCPVIFGLR